MVSEQNKPVGNIESFSLYKGLGQLGRVYINFATPIDLKEYADTD